jgi:phosphohistidine swiveling domain-containing protein
MNKVNWQYYFARKFSLQRFQVVINVFTSKFYWEHFRVRLKNVLVKPEEGGNHAIWLEPRECRRFINNLFCAVCKDLKSFYYYKRIIKRVQNEWVQAAKLVGKKVSRNLPNRKLDELYDIFIHHHQEHFNKPIWIAFPVEPVLSAAADRALKTLLRKTNRTSEYDKWFSAVFSPEEKNAITRLEEGVLKAAHEIKRKNSSKTMRRRKIKSLTKRFGFIPCYDVIDNPWGEEHFAKEVRQALKKSEEQIATELNDLKTRFRKRREEFRVFLKEFRMSPREKALFIMAHEMTFIKDERDDYRRMGCYFARPLFAEIGRRLKLTVKETASLTIEETKAFLHKNYKPDLEKARERVGGYLLMRKNGSDLIVASGEEMEQIIVREFGDRKSDLVKTAKGIVSCAGKISGRAVIVRTKHDLRRVFSGAILIAVTTNPDFVPAMRKSKAIITDEGGLTSHASIVSRELKVPCIVGTKNATKVFKDGDFVEVDAERGIVKLIKGKK